MNEDLLKYYDDIRRLSESKCSSFQDSEDLISETFLAAYSYLHRGGVIDHPKTWLANTFMHKYNSHLRRKYSRPTVVELSALESVIADDENDYIDTEEAARVRCELNYLSGTTREVMIRYYYNGQSVAEIAEHLGIPVGTVKSRLSAGRDKIKRGLTSMVERKNNIPARLNLSFSGSEGANYSPMCYVNGDLIVENLLILAYEKPLSIIELSEAIGIPTAYIEPIVERLVNVELMVQTEGKKYYSDFVIYKPSDSLGRFDAQIKFVDEHYDSFEAVVKKLLESIKKTSFYDEMDTKKRRIIERYSITHTLQRFQLSLTDHNKKGYPRRKDGGRWQALGFYFPVGYENKEYHEKSNYVISGGHRTSSQACNIGEAKELTLYEFDTPFFDNPSRWSGTCGFDNYFKEIHKLLWCIHKNILPENVGFSTVMLESIDRLIERTGLISRINGKLHTDIPILSREEYREIDRLITKSYDELVSLLENDYKEYLKGNILRLPSHLKSVRDVHRYLPATNYIVMAVVRMLYERGVHLSDIDYCCPPAVLVYDI